MASDDYLDRLEQWAEKVLEDTQRLPEDLPEEELREQMVLWYADFYAQHGDSQHASPDDPSMREWLIDEERMTPDVADQVLVKMRELTAAQ